jgi:hypothetical protein
MPDRDMPNLGRGRLIADACKDARIPRERRRVPNPRYLLGPAKALQISPPHSHPSGRSPGAPEGEDAEGERPFITALTISSAHGGLPAPAFFGCCPTVSAAS